VSRVPQASPKSFHAPNKIFEDTCVVEANDAISLHLDEFSSARVPRPFRVGRMRGAVDFDDEPPIPTDKVDKIRPDGCLTHEFVAAKFPVSQALPKPVFR